LFYLTVGKVKKEREKERKREREKEREKVGGKEKWHRSEDES